MTGRFHCDLLMQMKLIIPGVKFSFTPIPASNSFSIFTPTTTNYILSICNECALVCCVDY